MLDLLGLKITFLMKIKFNSIYYFLECVFIFEFNLICNIQNFMTINLTFSTWVIHITYTLLDHNSTQSIWEAHICINMMG